MNLFSLPRTPTNGVPTRLLIADDDLDNRELLVTFFEHHGFQVTSVPDGLQAVNIATFSVFDIAILDVSMPNMTGPTAAVRLKLLQPRLRIVFHTAIDEGLVKEGFSNADGYFRKPADLAAILQLMLPWRVA